MEHGSFLNRTTYTQHGIFLNLMCDIGTRDGEGGSTCRLSNFRNMDVARLSHYKIGIVPCHL